MQRDWLNYLMEASTTGRPRGSAQEASGASPGLGRAFPPEEQDERHLVRGNVFIHQGAAPPSAASMPLAPSSCQQPTPDGRAAANSSTAPVGNPQRINPASYASLGLSGLSAAALLASRGQEQGEMQPQQAQGGSYGGGDMRAEVMELRGMLERARSTIGDLNRAILRYEDENGKLRRLVEELTRMDVGRGSFPPRMDEQMRTAQPNMYGVPGGYLSAPPHQEHMRQFHDPHNGSPRPSPMFADQSRQQVPMDPMRPLAQPPPPVGSLGAPPPASAAASRGGQGQGERPHGSNANCDYSSGSEPGSVSSASEGAGTKKRPRNDGAQGGEEQGARRVGEGEGQENKVGCAAFVSTSSLSSEGADGDKKYRKSCDFCTTTKIRCDGLKPTCENCSKRSLKCNYSERKRPGPKIMGSSNDSVGGRSRSSLPVRSPGPVYPRGPPMPQGNADMSMGRPMAHEDPQRHRMQGTHSEAAAILMKLPGSMRGPREHEMAYADMAPGPGFVPPGHMAPHNPTASSWPMPLANHPYMNDDRNMRR